MQAWKWRVLILQRRKCIFKADVDSIDTNNAQRDGHLKAPDFFDAAQFPQITFEGVKLEKVRDEKYRLAGELTIRGITKPIILDVEYGGTIKDPWGNTRSGFTVEGKLNRKDFGLSWSQLTETGGMVAGFEVKLHANVEFIKEQSAATENDIAKAA